ncbi:DUF2383 domain-containing protein [Pseudenhygromyxa sp. WMMC2535]|uniref:DUF2383 domain-containing protein n=1 Tax=Pseudenhygromyxa sp. WMMC2535 TaxID=2712867 RepID=UPI0015541966|nr:DUF2383 domain-containing protein [Pseudenhygromyxa sp. WMMC2535]NVB40673.1 DUF2383 domain-containing protein [Pseudenhygromyxa sp. WMMC2535]
MDQVTSQDIDQFNEFLRGELAAVETYDQCIGAFEDNAGMRESLSLLRNSHAARVNKLTARIVAMGGEPDSSSGAWGTFAKMAEGGAKLFGKSAAISVLEEGEDHGKKLYKDSLEDLSLANRGFVRTQIIPEQQRSHNVLSRLQELV